MTFSWFSFRCGSSCMKVWNSKENRFSILDRCISTEHKASTKRSLRCDYGCSSVQTTTSSEKTKWKMKKVEPVPRIIYLLAAPCIAKLIIGKNLYMERTKGRNTQCDIFAISRGVSHFFVLLLFHIKEYKRKLNKIQYRKKKWKRHFFLNITEISHC